MSAISSALNWLRLGAVSAVAVAFMVGCGVVQTPEPTKAEAQAEQLPKPPFEPKQLEARARGALALPKTILITAKFWAKRKAKIMRWIRVALQKSY